MKKFCVQGLNHLGLVVEDMAAARRWFVDTLGFEILEDRGELLFLRVGRDCLAIKTPRMAVAKPEFPQDAPTSTSKAGWQALDHYGFYASSAEEVTEFAAFLKEQGVEILRGPYDRSDGRSVYFRDPCGMVGEYLYFLPAKNWM